MRVNKLESFLYWFARGGVCVLPFVLLLITQSMFFPFVSGKNFYFRIIVEVITGAWAGLLIINFKKYWPKWNILTIAFPVFVSALLVSAFFGINFSQSFWSNYERMDGVVTQVHLLALFFVLVGIFRARREWFYFLAVSIAVSVFLSIYGLLEHFGKINSFADSSRIIATLGNPLYVAAFLTFNIFLIGYFLIEIKSATLKYILSGILFMELAVVFVTQGRGAFIGLVAGATIVFSGFIFIIPNVKKKITLGFILVLLLSVPVFLNLFREVDFIKSKPMLSRFSNITREAGQARLNIWQTAISAFKEKPILGWGSENFIVPFAKYYNPKMLNQEPWFDRTHNMFLEWLVAGGVVVFSAYIFLLTAIILSIIKGLSRGAFQKRQIFVFVGMMIAYLVQLLFVFDTLATYFMFILSAGFFFVASSYPDQWTSKSSLYQSLKTKNDPKKNQQENGISFGCLTGVGGVFILFVVIISVVNIRPIMANRALMKALIYFNQQDFSESGKYFQNALRLSRGTFGQVETSEHLAFNTYKLFSNPDLLRKPEGEAIYRLTKDNLEKLTTKNQEKYPNIKQNILLAQLYHQRATFNGDATALSRATEEYKRTIDFAPNYVSVYPVYASFLAQTGRIQEAVAVAEKAKIILEKSGQYDPKIFYSKPVFYTVMKRYDEAFKSLEEIGNKYSNLLAKGKLDREMIENIVAITGQHGQGAVSFLEKINNFDKTLVSPLLMLAQINASTGDREKARFYAFEALKTDESLQEKVHAFLKELEK